TEAMAKGDEAALRRYGELSAAFEAAGGYETDTRLNKVANGLSISAEQRAQLFDALSGGERTRVNLGRLILEDTDILLLDEPTNHLDLAATEWLEDFLLTFKGTVLAISHDRYFLDRVVTRIVEIEDGRAEFYSGNYSFYVEEKGRRYEEKLRQYEKEQAKIAQLTEAAEALHLWAFMGNDKLHKRAFSMEKRIERMRTTDKPVKEKAMKARFGEKDFGGDEVFVADGLAKRYGDRALFSDVRLLMEPGDRVALLGENGTGKTTLLKILLKEETPDEGYVRFGPSVKAGYLPQIVRFEHPERSLVDTMLYSLGCTPQEARDRLAAFRFRGEDVFKCVSDLSGGEMSRLRLCMLMAANINLLILDEPTNHLDVASREWIEEAVGDYEGALLFVSHDRYFINRFAERVWMLEDGHITDFRGGFEAFRAQASRDLAKERTQKERLRRTQPKKGRPAQPAKLLAAAEREIAKAEARKTEVEAEMEKAACDFERLNVLYEEKCALEDDLKALYDRWEELALETDDA
ncbi:MAG TPA: ABC-F family ATP-binding cassette domain-containing protein, partial [Oscillospiraceae bacterium]|nr:ABC-F family ATP-binding cassette domain-containing protein [Oscillospiraceae bacterium]